MVASAPNTMTSAAQSLGSSAHEAPQGAPWTRAALPNRRALLLAGTLSALLLASACGGSEDATSDSGPIVDDWVNQKPLLHVASPDRLAVGESMTILGERFIDASHGNVYVQFRGSFFADDGTSNEVDHQQQVTAKDGKILWKMWPNVVFDATGKRLGRFVGNLTVLNQGNDGSQEVSEPLALSVEVKPSLIAHTIQPIGFECAPLVSGTLPEVPMALMVEAIGFREATPDNPLTFRWTFMAEQWKLAFDHGTLDPEAIIPKSGPLLFEDIVTSGTISHLEDGGTRNIILQVKDDLLGNTRLKELKTGQLANPELPATTPATINVAVSDAAGKTAQLAIDLKVHPRAEMHYDYEPKIAERYQPVMVTPCIPGEHLTGTDVNYHESSSESRARAMTFQWNANLSVELRPLGIICNLITANPILCDAWTWVGGINFSAGFGVNVNEHVSTDESKSLAVSMHILPGLNGAFYRQTTRLRHEAQLTGYTECGGSVNLGRVVLTDWMYTPDAAMGPECPPPTKLQPAEKFYD